MKQIKISTQKKVLYFPIINIFIIYVFTFMNMKYLKSKGADFGFFNIEYVFNLLGRALLYQIIFAPIGLFLEYLKMPFEISVMCLLIYASITTMLISWSWIRYQKKLGIE